MERMSCTARGYSYRNSMHGRRPRLNRRDLGLREHFVEPRNHCAQAAPDSTHGYNMLLSAQWFVRRKCDGQVVAVSSTSCFHIVANVPLGRSYSMAITWDGVAMLLPCYCHDIVMILPWYCHWHDIGHDICMLLPVIAMILSCYCNVLLP